VDNIINRNEIVEYQTYIAIGTSELK